MRNTLFFKECRQIVRSIPFLVYVAVLLFFFIAQYESDFTKVEKPQPGQSDYGTKISDDLRIIEPAAVKSFYSEFVRNSYTAYPVGFYKNVKLNAGQQREMAGILSELTGNPADQITDSSISTVKSDLTAEQFQALMGQADKLIGGGSLYGDTYLSRFGEVSKTYEDALKDYADIVKKDGVTGAYARYFCDYLGIVLALFPVFLAVSSGMKDRRTGMRDIIYSRRASSAKIVMTRYTAQVTTLFLPVILLAAYATAQVVTEYPDFKLQLLAFIGYSFGWLLPTLMVSASVGMILTELTDSAVGIVVQGLWWFLGLFAGVAHIDGGYGRDLVLRHNTVGNTQVYLDSFITLLWNRIAYAVFALILVTSAIWVYERKRRGKWNVYFGFQKNPNHHRVQSAS